MKLIKDPNNKISIGFILNSYGIGIGLMHWPWVKLDYPGLNFWHGLCCAEWFFSFGSNKFQIRYLWFTIIFIFPCKSTYPE